MYAFLLSVFLSELLIQKVCKYLPLVEILRNLHIYTILYSHQCCWRIPFGALPLQYVFKYFFGLVGSWLQHADPRCGWQAFWCDTWAPWHAGLVFVAHGLCGMWDLNFPTKDWIMAPALQSRVLTTGLSGKFPSCPILGGVCPLVTLDVLSRV